jgi:hypothetical protein
MDEKPAAPEGYDPTKMSIDLGKLEADATMRASTDEILRA